MPDKKVSQMTPFITVIGSNDLIMVVVDGVSPSKAIKWSDLIVNLNLATVATTGDYSDLGSLPTLGTAAAQDVGTATGNVVQLDANGFIAMPVSQGVRLVDDNWRIVVNPGSNGSDYTGGPFGDGPFNTFQANYGGGSSDTYVIGVANGLSTLMLKGNDGWVRGTLVVGGGMKAAGGGNSAITFDSNGPLLRNANNVVIVGSDANGPVLADTGGQFFSTDGSGNATFINGLSANLLSLQTATSRAVLTMGGITSISTSLPESIDQGGTYSDTAGQNLKHILYDDGTYIVGSGVSLNQYDFAIPTGFSYNWYINGVRSAWLDASGATFAGGVTSEGTLGLGIPASVDGVVALYSGTNLTGCNIHATAFGASYDLFLPLGLPGTSLAAWVSDGSGNLSWVDIGTAASNLVQLDASSKLPAVDGSQLTNLPLSLYALIASLDSYDGGQMLYTAANPAFWASSTPPTTIGAAIDRIVACLYFLNGNVGP